MARTRPTLRSLAAEAGVSAATMSFALRNSREISPATRERLQKLAAARGYRPDPHVAKLMSHLRMRAPARARANLCGLCQNWAPQPAPRGNYFERLCAGLRQRAEELGYAFSTLTIEDYPHPGQLDRVLVSRGVEGLLIMPLRQPTDLTHRLNWRAFSTVAVTSTIIAPQFHRVLPHHFDNILLACRRLTEAGFRRIGMAMAMDWDRRVNHRWSGALAWQNLLGGTEPVRPLLDDGNSLNLNPESFSRWLAQERPDAVLTQLFTPDAEAIQRVLSSLPAARRPKIVSVNWPNPGADCGIDQCAERIGIAAIEALAAMFNRGEKGVPDWPNSTLIDGQWVPGELNPLRTKKGRTLYKVRPEKNPCT